MLNKSDVVKVANRDSGSVGYSIPEMGIKRIYQPGETKEITMEELRKLSYLPGGQTLINDCLVVYDKEALAELNPDYEPEYFYSGEDVRRVMTLGSQDEFLDMLDFAPAGVINMIKDYAIKLPLSDLRKIEALRKKTGFDTTRALENIKNENGEVEIVEAPKRRVASETTQ